MGLNATLATARQSLDVFSAGVQLAGQNIANASTPGYIRESLLLEPSLPYQSGSLILGTGVNAVGIQQQIDVYLEQRIHTANGEVSTATIKNSIFKQLEGELQELGESDLSTAFTDFFDALQNLAAQPDSHAMRDLIVYQGQELSSNIRSLAGRVEDLQENQSKQAELLVKEANELIVQVHELNAQISKLESAGLSRSEAGAARSQRYQALSRLSEILPIQFRELENGSVDVFCDSDFLVLSNSTQQLQIVTTASGDNAYRIELSKTGHDVARSGGELRGVIEGRDEILGGLLSQLDQLAGQLILEFNKLHASGEGLSGFTSMKSVNRVIDPSVPLNQTGNGLEFLPTHGSFTVQVVNSQTGLKESTTISIDLDGIGTESSFADIRDALDGIPNLSASITPRGELEIHADSGFEFQFSNDTSGVLAILGINTFFTGSSASTIGVTSVVADDSRFFAAGRGGGPSDGRNVTELGSIFDKGLSGLDGLSVQGFYEQSVANVAHDSAAMQAMASGFATFRDSLVSQQQQFTGVSLDEEAIRVLELQRGYQAAARIISTVNDLYNVLLNL